MWQIENGLKTQDHLVAVSSNIPAAVAYGIDQSNIFPMWDFSGN